MTRFLSDRKQVETTTYDLDREVLEAAWACATREEVQGIIRANGHMVSRPVAKQLKDIAKSKPKTGRYVEPKVTPAPAVKTCSGGMNKTAATGMTAADEARWLDPWGR